jgi:hypothetical protein
MKRVLALTLALAGGACEGEFSGGGGPSDPRIESIVPAQGAPGDTVEIRGRRFCGPDASNVGEDGRCVAPVSGLVTFALDEDTIDRGTVVSWSATVVEVEVPDLPEGDATVVLTASMRRSNEAGFAILP